MGHSHGGIPRIKARPPSSQRRDPHRDFHSLMAILAPALLRCHDELFVPCREQEIPFTQARRSWLCPSDGAGFITSEFGNPLAECANACGFSNGVVLKERAPGRAE